MPKSVFTDAHRILIEILVAARREAQLTQVELAGRVGRPQPFISFIERGERRVDVLEFYALARAMGHDPETLFSRVAQRLPRDVEI